jgi:DNA-binding NtrC family response regulator
MPVVPRVIVRVRDLPEPLTYAVQPGSCLLIGRLPDPSRLVTETGELAESITGMQVLTARIDSPRVSGNHLLAVCAPGGNMSIYEMQSRNGTSLRLYPGQPVRLRGDVTVDLAFRGGSVAMLGEPRPADWTDESDFGMQVVAAINEWLAPQTVDLRAELIAPGKRDGEGSSFHLADDHTLLVASLSSGTYDPQIGVLLDRIRVYIHEQNIRLEQFQKRVDGMIVSSPVMRDVLRRVAEAAEQGRRTVLLGPTGAGKEWLARCYHRYSPRSKGPFAALNCALLDRDLLYAQLFGAKRGSFTGAVNDVQGLVEASHEGTMFLDELGEMSLDVQKALLRFLDTRGEYQRLGDPKLRRADVQLVCASNARLDEVEYRMKHFRDDLWYRLSSAVIRVPPLRERPEDVLAFLQLKLLRNSTLRVVDALSPAALRCVLADPLPGNFRDLENFVDRLPAAQRPGEIEVAQVEAALREGRGQSSGTPNNVPEYQGAVRDSGRIRRMRLPDKPSENRNVDWEGMAVEAIAAFLADHGDSVAGWGELHALVEKVSQAGLCRPGHRAWQHRRGQQEHQLLGLGP